jgi:hypothetical protein
MKQSNLPCFLDCFASLAMTLTLDRPRGSSIMLKLNGGDMRRSLKLHRRRLVIKTPTGITHVQRPAF